MNNIPSNNNGSTYIRGYVNASETNLARNGTAAVADKAVNVANTHLKINTTMTHCKLSGTLESADIVTTIGKGNIINALKIEIPDTELTQEPVTATVVLEPGATLREVKFNTPFCKIITQGDAKYLGLAGENLKIVRG